MFNAVNNQADVGPRYHQAAPVLTLASYLVAGQFDSADSFRWYTADASSSQNRNIGALNVLDQTDPAWTGITITLGQSPDLSSANWRLTAGATPKAGVTVLAVNPSITTESAVMYAAPGTFGIGSYESYFIGAMTGTNGQAAPFTADGQQVFLNAISAIAIPEPGAALLGSLGLLALLRRRRG